MTDLSTKAARAEYARILLRRLNVSYSEAVTMELALEAIADTMAADRLYARREARHEALEHAAREVERLMLVIGDNHDQRLSRAAEAVRKMKETKL